MQYLHAVAAVLAIAAIGVVMHNNGKSKTVEGLTSSADGTVAEQMKKAIKGLDGGSEMMADISGVTKDKADVKSLVSAYKTYLQNTLLMAVAIVASKTGSNLSAVTQPDTDMQQTLKEMAVLKDQLKYVEIAEKTFDGTLPGTGGVVKSGMW